VARAPSRVRQYRLGTSEAPHIPDGLTELDMTWTRRAAALPKRPGISLRLGLLHLAPETGALEHNRALIEEGNRGGGRYGRGMGPAGELVVSGYRFRPLLGTDWISSQPDGWMRHVAELSASLGVVSIVSHPERDKNSGELFNTLFVIGRERNVRVCQSRSRPQ
jgi:hypothetical protein